MSTPAVTSALADTGEINLIEALGVAIEAADKGSHILWQGIEKYRMVAATAATFDTTNSHAASGAGPSVAETETPATSVMTQYASQCGEAITRILRQYSEEVQREKTHLRFAFWTKALNPQTPPSDDYTWIVDPIDSTTSFTHRLPDCSISIGLTYRKLPVLAVVFTPFISSGVRLTVAASAVLKVVQQQQSMLMSQSSSIPATAGTGPLGGLGKAAATSTATPTPPLPSSGAPVSSPATSSSPRTTPVITHTTPRVVPECNGELYTAIRGLGAFVNGRRIHVNAKAAPVTSVVVFNYPDDVMLSPAEAASPNSAAIRQQKHDAAVECSVAMRRELLRLPVAGLRCYGSCVTTLAQVAAGRVDAYLEPAAKAWDVCVGSLLVTEAGGVVSNMLGKPLDMTHDTTIVAAATQEMAQLMTEKSVRHGFDQYWLLRG
ncbi:hypothetical protein JKF63_06127 [Porcisia hertigi]|uniref:Inositol-phosphate phosphatase n=1 Tax=Porcisia hertigi TaxID=2761500 RepID=A0A836ITR3_9TRYP|nr:hypothetical protein JKF63_06127 [Porcisia hertigi]